MTTKDLSLTHNIRPSSLTEKAPLLLLLHGYGSDENDLFSFASELPKEYIVVSAKAPHSLQPYGNAWYAINFDAAGDKFSDTEQAIKSRERIMQFIDELIDAYPIDEKDINLLGFSQGTILSFAAALSYPEKFNKIIGLSGYIDKNMLVNGFDIKDFSHLKVYNSHGSQDQVIPVDWARNNQEILNELNIEFKYEEFPVGHGVAPQNFASLMKWLVM
ncbi:alpha/beta hydrolase [Psychroflexus planctonicus]|uniref:Phospholipase n=1 Tax=Psychroflexus planctonicus TaxID=1526575 RepID=A0ABQ1SFW5_9FLAO|nr:alpha/beta fold hydrolase [Psychroflexus planctonicus]GGE30250.1 phospholipase [Psychroflexus planctonicus]